MIDLKHKETKGQRFYHGKKGDERLRVRYKTLYLCVFVFELYVHRETNGQRLSRNKHFFSNNCRYIRLFKIKDVSLHFKY